MIKTGEDADRSAVSCSLCDREIPPSQVGRFYTQHSNPLCEACAGKQDRVAYTTESKCASGQGE